MTKLIHQIRSSSLLEVRERQKTQSFTKLGSINYMVGESQKTQSPTSKVDHMTDINIPKISSPSHVYVRERPKTHSPTVDGSATAMVRESHQTQSLIIEINKSTDVNIPKIS